MIKGLFFDLDDTLLNSRKEISKGTRIALEKCRSQGIKLFIATARPPLLGKMLGWDDATLALFGGGIYYNGGCVAFESNKDYIVIKDEVVNKTLQIVNQNEHVNVAVQLVEEGHSFRFPLSEPNSQKLWGITHKSIYPYPEAAKNNVVKIVVFYGDLVNSTKKLEEKLVEDLKSVCSTTAQFYLTDDGKCAQIMGKGVSKLMGVEKIATSLGFGSDEIAVFGDDTNDVEMLAGYKNSIAMGNANEFVKSKAAFVTHNNDNDGIPYALANILNLIE